MKVLNCLASTARLLGAVPYDPRNPPQSGRFHLLIVAVDDGSMWLWPLDPGLARNITTARGRP